MGYISVDEMVVDIFQKFLDKDPAWVEHIEAPTKFKSDIACFEDDMVESLHHGTLAIKTTDNEKITPSWESFGDALTKIASSDFSWVLKGINSSWDVEASRSADLLVQIWLFGAPVYFY